MSTESKAARLYQRDQTLHGSSVLYTDLANRWEAAPEQVKQAYYGFVAAGHYEIEFEEDNND